MRPIALYPLCLVVAVGCAKEPYQVASVSGRVTLNGKALPNAWVHFAPMGSLKSDPGPTSQGKTDANGQYTLRLSVAANTPGAVVGKSKVYITTADYAGQGPQPDAGGKSTKEILPARYHRDSILTFDVLPEGTDKANFDLKVP
jgi:hypothetical protein